ncbi:MAG: translocation/assembly module TamB domain-containing protein, partial [Bacteroidota bacterium]
AQLQNFMILGDTTEFRVHTLLATDQKTRFSVHQLSTFFRLSQQRMEFTDLSLKAGGSTITDSVIFTFNGQRELSDFINKVTIHAQLKNTIVQPRDLALFAPEAAKLTKPINLSGTFSGLVNNFKFTDMEIGMGNTHLRGSLDMEGLPDVNETFIILNLKKSTLEFTDLDFLFKDNVTSRLTPLGRVTLDGQFLGYPSDFVAKGNLSGELGRVTSDINFKVNEDNFDKSIYSGKLALENFDLGRYLNDTINFQRVTLDGNVKGSGLTLQTADFTLNGKVNSIGIRNYDYTNIMTNARFNAELFNGMLSIDDPNLQFTAQGSVDLRKGKNLIKVQAQIDTAFLHNLKLTPKNIFLHTKLNVNFTGLHLDSLAGTADLEDFNIHYDDEWLRLPNIHLDAQGNFLLSDLSKDVQKLIREILLNIHNDKREIATYYATRNYRPKNYETQFKFALKNVAPIIELIDVDLLISNQTVIEGKFKSGYTTILQAYTRVDSLAYNKSLMTNTEIELTASKIADSTSVLAMGFVNSEKQMFNPNFKTKNLTAEVIWDKSHINFGVDADQDGQSNYVRLKGAIDFLKDSTQIRMLPSTVKLLEKDWTFDARNLITINDNEITVEQLTINNAHQIVAVNGKISEDPKEKLSIQVDDLDLSILDPLTGRKMTGTLNALFDVSNYYNDPFVQNDITIDSLTVDKFLVGDITGNNHWDTLENKFQINFFIDRNDNRIVNLNGFYNPSRESNPLDVTAKLENANLKILEPFLEDIFSNIGGTVTGDYRITGNLQSPAISGEGTVAGGQIMINYLKTIYQFQGVIGLSPNSIFFKNIELSDVFRNKGKLNGTITHQNFYSMRINIDANFKDFQVLNTTARDNSLFYGQGYATGDVNIFGPVSNLKITANARTDKNTRIYIPIGGASEVEKKEFIKFVSFTDSTFQKNISNTINNKLDLTGVTLDFNLDVTPDAYCEIIFDIKAGDIIRGRGNGEIQLQLDTKGEFNMFGPFEFTQGWYNFTLYDIINKEFEIKKGSRITWFGDAYAGNLNISASYNQLASFGPIVSDQTLATSPQLRRKYPVQVILKLDGPMLSPQINFDILTRDLPQSIIVDGRAVRLDFEFQAFKNKMDEQELKRQVFSLIVLRRFSPPESFNTSGSIVNSVSELLSNQLSNWVSQVDENLEVDVDLSTLDQEAFNTFQLRLSYTFLNGRLRITRDGTFYGNQNTAGSTNNSNANLSSIAGDWTVDYLLTADGKLKVKMYNRTNINPILNTLGSQNSVTTGVSLTHTQSFNELKDLWKSARSKRKKENQGNEQPDPNVNKDATKEDDDGSE